MMKIVIFLLLQSAGISLEVKSGENKGFLLSAEVKKGFLPSVEVLEKKEGPEHLTNGRHGTTYLRFISYLPSTYFFSFLSLPSS